MRAALAAGAFLILTANSPAQAKFMYVVEDQIILSGETQHGDFERFKRLLDEHPGKISTVVLRDGLGGAGAPTMQIAALIRNMGLRTAVSGRCWSACAYIFLGGASRHFTDEQPPGRTYLGFHPGYNQLGIIDPALFPVTRHLLLQYTDGKLSPAVLERILSLRRAAAALYVFDAERLQRRDGASLFLCRGYESRQVADCETISGTDAYEQGFVTSKEVIKVKGAPPGPARFRPTADDPG